MTATLWRDLAASLRWGLMPRFCLACAQTPVFAPAAALCLCPPCRASLWRNDGPRCRTCDTPRPSGAGSRSLCPMCVPPGQPRQNWAWQQLRTPYLFLGPLRLTLLRGKFAGEAHVFAPLGQAVAQDAQAHKMVQACSMLVPVPLHIDRLLQRGYQQSALLAQSIGRSGQRPVIAALHKIRATTTQSSQDAQTRQDNLTGAFSADARVAGQACLLIDDIVTTGATLQAASEALLQAGASSVAALAVARTPLALGT